MFAGIDWIATLSFLLVTAFTPGPNNLSCASMGVLFGYKRSLNYILGIIAGVLVISLLAGWAADLILTAIPIYETYLRVIGAIYLLWLAFRTVRTSYAEDEQRLPPLGFKDGLIMQVVNVKVILFLLTLYAVYLQPVTGHFLPLIITAVGLAARAFLTNSFFVLFGASFRRWLRKPAVGQAFNVLVAIALVYSALDLLNIPQYLSSFFR